MSCVVKVADFASRSYWDRRFASESSFEWLQPSSAILPAIKSELQTLDHDDPSLLHLGCGSSDLSNQLRRLVYTSRNSPKDAPRQPIILNIDFAAAAIETGRRREQDEFGNDRSGGMRWGVVDLLDYDSFRRTCTEHCGRPFDLIVEKSCTDALACGNDVQLGEILNVHDGLYVSGNPDALTAPEVALATYLATVTQPGGAWIALSYSSERFDFLRDAKQSVANLWSIEAIQKVLVIDDHKDDNDRTVYRPEIFHFVYTIRRNPYGKV